MIDHFLDRLTDDIRQASEEMRAKWTAHLTSMACATMEDHRRNIGRLEGMDAILAAAQRAIERARGSAKLD